MVEQQSDLHELTSDELDAVSGGEAHRDRIRDAVLDLLRKMSEIKGLY